MSVKKLLSLPLVILLLVFCGQGHAKPLQSPLALALSRDDGTQVSLNDYKGKVIYLDFWASWCAPCRKSFPWMQQMYHKYRETDLAIIAVNLDTDSQLGREFLQQLDADFDVLYDPEGRLARRLDLQGMPSSFLFDRNGKLLGSHVGFFTERQSQYEAELKRALKE
ncbi:TlpA family protein disulfide reductase [Shewanella indica]|uniref:TlpA disulfide reductase family protein n=1 Tax=Shewanella TaxID=22 RepID=UPI001F1902BA|nr:TlpA disulfide reductase family protein [Shewanella indica]MCE9793346.1 TlpA family protein disulfide reductase [Shewanella indica]